MTTCCILTIGCSSKQDNSMTTDDASTSNILLQPWTGPYNGVPPLDKIAIADFKPALLNTFDRKIHGNSSSS